MDYLRISHSPNLRGSVRISGAKNAALPLIAASILAKNPFRLENLPQVVDVAVLLKLLEMLGASYQMEGESSVVIDTAALKNTKVIYDIVRKMRASILLLGPLLARFGKCQVSLPGGCAIGSRPVDLHIKAMQKMGANIEIRDGYINATAKNGLRGAHIDFEKISVTGSENVLMAAALARGKTTITNAAKEPEVAALCYALRHSGVEVWGIGEGEIEICGTDGVLLNLAPHTIIPDRIEAGTYLCAGAITNSHISVTNAESEHLGAVIAALRGIGFGVETERGGGTGDTVTIFPAKNRESFELTTSEYPGFPTDMQAQFMALATQCAGVSTIKEQLFENRFMHINELQRLGANIALSGNVATITGGANLIGADVMATDLRASSALVLAGLVAANETRIHRIYHLDRGYAKIEEKLGRLGVAVERMRE